MVKFKTQTFSYYLPIVKYLKCLFLIILKLTILYGSINVIFLAFCNFITWRILLNSGQGVINTITFEFVIKDFILFN